MTWTRISDDFFDRPDILALSRSARLLHVEALVWCNRALTDGHLPAAALRRLTDSPTPDEDIEELVAADLWAPVDPWVVGAGWMVKWSDQETAERVEKRKADNRRRQEESRKRRERHALGDHSLCSVKYCDQKRKHKANDHSECVAEWCHTVVTRDVTRDVTTPRPGPSRPVPAQPEGAGTETGRCAHGVRRGVDGTGCAKCAEEATALVAPPAPISEDVAS